MKFPKMFFIIDTLMNSQHYLGDRLFKNIVRGLSSENFGIIANQYSGITKKMKREMRRLGFANFLHQRYGVPDTIATMFDSGGYQMMSQNRLIKDIDTFDILEVYRDAKVDFGMMLDFPISHRVSRVENVKRMKFTRQSLRKILGEMREHDLMESVNLVPVVHGYDRYSAEKQATAIKQILDDFGYEPPMVSISLTDYHYFLTSARYRFTHMLIDTIGSHWKDTPYHALGVGYHHNIAFYLALGMSSFDSSTNIMDAYLGKVHMNDLYVVRDNGVSLEDLEVLKHCKCGLDHAGTDPKKLFLCRGRDVDSSKNRPNLFYHNTMLMIESTSMFFSMSEDELREYILERVELSKAYGYLKYNFYGRTRRRF